MIIWRVKDQEIELSFKTRAIQKFEKCSGINPISIFKENELPKVTDVLDILRCASGKDEIYDIFDTWLEEHQFAEIVPILIELFTDSGLLRVEQKN